MSVRSTSPKHPAGRSRPRKQRGRGDSTPDQLDKAGSQPAATSETDVPALAPEAQALQRFRAWLAIALAASALLVVWARPGDVAWAAAEPLLLQGAVVSVCLWVLAIACAMNRANAEQERRGLKVVRQRETLVAEPVAPAAVAPVRLTHWPAMAVLVASLASAVALRLRPELFEALRLQWSRPLWLPIETTSLEGATVVRIIATAALGLAAMAVVINHRRAWCLGLERHAAEGSERLAAEALNGMPVMISICTPDGRRRRMNRRYLEVMGGGAAVRIGSAGVIGPTTGEESGPVVAGVDDPRFAGRAWFDLVHEDDRELFDKVFGDVAGGGAGGPPRRAAMQEIEYGVKLPESAGGANRWIRERFVPRRSEDGTLVGYLAVGIDITAQVENETENARVIADLREENHDQHEHIEEIEEEVGRLNAELATVTRARDRLQEKLDAFKDTVRTADEKIAAARAEANQAKAEMRQMRTEHQQMKTEHRKVSQSLARAEREIEALRRKEATLETRIEKREELLESAKATATEARQKESQLRVKVSKLTTRCQDLKEQLEGALDEQNQTTEQIEARKAAAEAAATQQVERFAAEMRGRIADVCQMVQRVRLASVNDSHLAELESAQASMASLAIMLDGALGATADEAWPVQGEPEQRAFDVRSAAQSVARMLEGTAEERGVKLKCVIAPDFPPHLMGDPVRTREAWLLLAERSMQIVEGGEVTVRLAHSGAGPALVAARCEVSHDSSRLSAEQLRELFAMDDDAEERLEGDSGLFESAVAWRLLKAIGADFGLEVNSGGGFTIWFSMSLARPHMADHDGRGSGAPRRIIEEHAEGEAEAPLSTPASAPRLPQELLKSNLGEVKELGQDSARLQTTHELEGLVDLVIQAPEGAPVHLSAEVESCHRDGMRHWDVILRFTDLTPPLRARIAQIALTNRRSSTIESVGS